jgi:hypothetical protein
MMNMNHSEIRVLGTPLRRLAVLAAAAGLAAALNACTEDQDLPTAVEIPLEEATGFGRSYGIWTPSEQDTCSREIHDAYAVVGPDGKAYPTWHPPVDPVTGCTFGHEHGRDPSGSDLFAQVGHIPFGYANEYLEASGFGASRHEDHVGHKIEWENDMVMTFGDGGDSVLEATCDVLVKLHQGSHSPDAFTNNMHELAYHIRCTDGTGMSVTILTPIGNAGELVDNCSRDIRIQAGSANPFISPDGGGRRVIPTAACMVERVVSADRPRFDSALRESWEIGGRVRTVDGRTLASFNPYFQIIDPSRFFDPEAERAMGRPIDLCARPELANVDRCEALGGLTVAWDDPRSPFKGTRRFVDINSNRVVNADGPEIWYTDPLGRNGQTEPFPGAIAQYISARDNSGMDLRGRVMGRDRRYDAEGVHAPN